ncbi:MAG TPA: hypothetical protein D7I01_00335 [Candidatus Poseidoniales archaeon]|nr:MAG TPA: hypothetical protein D7I01_00335 [Candidatus Poseidoniales archaeon]
MFNQYGFGVVVVGEEPCNRPQVEEKVRPLGSHVLPLVPTRDHDSPKADVLLVQVLSERSV